MSDIKDLAMEVQQLRKRVTRLELALRALAESVTAEPAAHINHEVAVRKILDPPADGGDIEGDVYTGDTYTR